MCRPVKCQQCNKVTWAGCGAHVAQVMANVPQPERCTCRDEPQPRATRRTAS
jgi:hypothetical protein